MLVKSQDAVTLREQENTNADVERLSAWVEYVAIMTDVDLGLDDEEEGMMEHE